MEPQEEALAHRRWALVSASRRRFDARWRLVLDEHLLRLDAQLAARLIYTHVQQLAGVGASAQGDHPRQRAFVLVQTDNPDVRAFGNPSALLVLPSKQLESLVRCSRSRRLTFGSRRHPLLVPALLLFEESGDAPLGTPARGLLGCRRHKREREPGHPKRHGGATAGECGSCCRRWWPRRWRPEESH